MMIDRNSSLIAYPTATPVTKQTKDAVNICGLPCRCDMSLKCCKYIGVALAIKPQNTENAGIICHDKKGTIAEPLVACCDIVSFHNSVHVLALLVLSRKHHCILTHSSFSLTAHSSIAMTKVHFSSCANLCQQGKEFLTG